MHPSQASAAMRELGIDRILRPTTAGQFRDRWRDIGQIADYSTPEVAFLILTDLGFRIHHKWARAYQPAFDEGQHVHLQYKVLRASARHSRNSRGGLIGSVAEAVQLILVALLVMAHLDCRGVFT